MNLPIHQQFLTLLLKLLVFLSITVNSAVVRGEGNIPREMPLKQGNFSLANSQQPGPFFSFGQFIVDENQAQLIFDSNNIKLSNAHYYHANTNLIYGISNYLAVSISLPYAVNFQEQLAQSSGLSDIDVQMEYAFIDDSNSHRTQLATIIGGVSLPLGSLNKVPPTGFGSPSFFIGTTYSQTYLNWYVFSSPGITWFQPTDKHHLGSLYYYQFGFGKNIISKSNDYTLFSLLEFDGQYRAKDVLCGNPDLDSGGNLILITPSLTFSTNNLITQIGISLPLLQQLNGTQFKVKYIVSAKLGWTFF